MKSLTKRNLLLVVLSLIVALCSLTFAATVKPVKATGTAITIGTFEVMEEAQIRIGKDENLPEGSSSGIRFRARVDADTHQAICERDDVYMGFLITPKAFFDQVTDGKYHESLTNYVNKKNDERGIVVDEENTFYQESGFWYTNGAVQGMLEKNIDLEYTVIAYIYDGTSYQYSVPSADFSRTYIQVANKAILSGKNSVELVQSADYLSSLGTDANPVSIENKQEYQSFANGAQNNAFENVYFNIANDIDLGKESEGDKISTLPMSFAGTLTASENVSVTYESDAYTSLAENYQMVKGFYSCTFNQDRDWTDKLIYAARVSGSATPSGEPNTKALTTEEVAFKDPITGLNVTKTAAKLIYDTYADRTFAAVDFGFELEGNVAATHITFTVGYKFKDGVSEHMTGNIIGGTTVNTQKALMSEELAFSDETVNTWMTFTYSLEDAISTQTSYYPTKFEGMDGQACYLRLFRVLQRGTEDYYDTYITDVKFETSENLEPINITSSLSFSRGDTSSVFRSGVISTILASTKTAPIKNNDNEYVNIIAALSGAPADINDVWWCQPTATNNYVYISYGDYTTSQLIDLGYTHLSVSVAILTHTTNSTHVLVNGVVDFTDDSGTSITLNKDTSGQWLNYTIDLSTLEDGALNNKATLLNSKKPTTPSTQDENDTYVYSSTYVQNLFVYAEIVKN